ncbi:hypothetical protein GCM10022278_12360 [Allohahella marinimesophila]|uniref:Uncharacterized protein n=1 Tax=Allohahella marinimesophila TaxID=1054972 RepID=A0ABP7NX80_9GAMM
MRAAISLRRLLYPTCINPMMLRIRLNIIRIIMTLLPGSRTHQLRRLRLITPSTMSVGTAHF